MRNTNRLMGGFDRNELPTQLISDQNLTSEPIKTNQIGLSVSAYSFVVKIESDTISATPANNIIILASDIVQVGDIISFTSGTLLGLEIKVKSVNGLIVTLVNDLPSDPSIGDTVDILRYKYPVVNSSGVMTVIADQGTTPWIISGTVTADIAPLSTFQTSQYTVGLTAIQITPTPLANRNSVSLKVICSNQSIIYVGNSSGVTSSTGFPLFNGDSVQLDINGSQTIYAISSVASNTLFALELA